MNPKFDIVQWFIKLSNGWKLLLVGGSFVSLLITATLTIEHFRVKAVSTIAVIELLQKDKIDRDKRDHIKDSIETKRHNEISTSLGNIFGRLKNDSIARNTFQGNYSRLVWDKFGKEWMKYMNGMSVTVIQSPYEPSKSLYDEKPEYKIMFEKVDTNKLKK